ncbi:CD1375 family protein [uncultured Dysosmobacter sp.]
MAVVYATLIVKGKKTMAQVPDRLKAEVKELLDALEITDVE